MIIITLLLVSFVSDVIEDEVATSKSLAQEQKFLQQQQQQQQSATIDTYRDLSTSVLPAAKMEENGVDDGGIHHNSKYEELLRQQLQHKVDSLDESTIEKELALSHKSEQNSVNGSGSKRLTPVGDIDKEIYLDGYSSLPAGGSGGLDTDDARDAGKSSLPASLGGSRPGSGRIDDVLGGLGSSSPSARKTPTRETIGDVLDSEAILGSPGRLASRQTPVEGSPHSSARGLPHSSARGSPHKDALTASQLLESRERLYGSQELVGGSGGEQHSSRPASYTSSRHSSRPPSAAAASGSRPGSIPGSRAQSVSSLSSEAELSQFFESNARGKSGLSDVPITPTSTFDTHPDESATLPPIMRGRPSSLPTYSTQPPTSPDKRTYTPDHRTMLATGDRQPLEDGLPRSNLTGRVTPRSALSSRTSSRTVTPTPAAGSDREVSLANCL